MSPEAFAILKDIGGHTDVFGGAYSLQAGSPGADAFGNSRPFQTEPNTSRIAGLDYFNVPADNVVYNRGPVMNLVDSPSFPSGHTTYGYMGSLVLAVVFPERFQQMITRAAEYGNDRILMGAHYAMDVIAGRTMAMYDLAHLLANNSSYVGHNFVHPARHPGASDDSRLSSSDQGSARQRNDAARGRLRKHDCGLCSARTSGG